MDQKDIISPIINSTNVFSKVVDIYKKKDPDFNPMAIKAWGVPEKPLFNIKELERCLGKKNIRQVLTQDSKKDDNIFEYGRDYVKHYALSNGKMREMIFFTYIGMHKYIVVSRGKISNIYRDFLFILVEKLFEQGIITKDEAINDLKNHIELYKNREKKLEEDIFLLNDKNCSLIKDRQFMKLENDRKDILIATQNKKIDDLESICDDNIDNEPFGDRSMLDCLKKKFMKKMYIYKFDAKSKKKSTRKKKRIISISEELDIDFSDSSEYEELDISFDDIYDEDSINYYKLSYNILKDSEKVDVIYIGGAKHKDLLFELLEKKYKTDYNSVFLTSISNLKEKAQKTFILLR